MGFLHSVILHKQQNILQNMHCKEQYWHLQFTIVRWSSFHHICWLGIGLMLPHPPPGLSGIKNFNPGIFRDGILSNPGIPGFFGTGFPNIFDPGILLKSFGIFRDFHFCFICLSNRIIFINIYHHRWHNHHHYHCHSSSPFIGIIISDCVERASLLNVEFYVLSQCAVKKHAFITPITIKMCV